MDRRRSWCIGIAALVFITSMSVWEFVKANGVRYYQQAPVRLLYVLVLTVAISIVVILVDSFWRRAEKRTPPPCQKCGYDLTGNVSGVCPECGEKI